MKQLTRREFLNLCGASSVGLMLAACGVTPTPTATPLPSSTATTLPTITALPAATSTPTPTPMPTNTPASTLPHIVVSAWASDSSGKVKPQIMYRLVGAVNKRHHQFVDAGFAMMRLGVEAEDLTQVSDHNLVKSRIIEKELDTNDELKRQLLKTRDELVDKFHTQDPSKFTVIIEGTGANRRITQAMFDNGGEEYRYKLVNSALVEISKPLERKINSATKETEFAFLPKLQVEGKCFVREDTGEAYRLEGYSLMNPLHVDQKPIFPLADTLKLMENAKSLGVNWIDLPTITGRIEERWGDILAMVEKAEQLGMYIKFTPGSLDGTYSDIAFGSKDYMEKVVPQLIKLANGLKQYNHVMIDLWNEPSNRIDPNDPTSPVFDPNKVRDIADTVVTILRDSGYEDTIGVPGTDWSRDVRIYTKRPLSRQSNTFYRVQFNPTPATDPYFDDKTTPEQFAPMFEKKYQEISGWLQEAVAAGLNVVIGEYGLPKEKLLYSSLEADWCKRSTQLFDQLGISYYQFGLQPWGSDAPYSALNAKTRNLTEANIKIASSYSSRGIGQFESFKRSPPQQMDQ